MDRHQRKPLDGRRIVVTRARVQAVDLATRLESLGAEVVSFPTIQVVAPEDPGPLRRAVRDLSAYDWLVFTSVNGVERFFGELEGAGLDDRALAGLRVACVGPATAAALERHGARADVVPERYVAEAVLESLDSTGSGSQAIAGARVLLPLAAGARPVLADGLVARGAIVDRVEAYRSVATTVDATPLRHRLTAGEIDVLTFTSSSTVDNFVITVGTEIGNAKVAAIGPVTAETARRHGLPVEIEATEHTIPGLVAAVIAHFGGSATRPKG